MRIHIRLIPSDIIALFKLNDLVDQYGWIYIEVIWGIHGLPHAGLLANKLISQRLNNHPWILTSQTHTKIMATCTETHFIHIVSGRFWNWICWTREHRSSYDCVKDVLWKDHSILEGKAILWYNNEMKWYKTVSRHINAQIRKGSFAQICS